MPEQKEEKRQIPIEKGEVTPEQMEEIEAGEFVTVKEIADRLRYSYQWVIWMLREGRIKGIKPFGSRWRVPKSEFERIMREGTPALPRQEVKKPALIEIDVEDQRVIDKIKEPEKREEKPPRIFPFDFSALGGGKK